jgi:RNA 2',3'-cyclic 3'-phosphodiesterase
MSRGATARLFVAIDPPAAVCEALAAWAREAMLELSSRLPAAVGPPSRAPGRPSARVRPSRSGARPLRLLHPDALHLTLIFLGNRPVAEIEAIGAALATCPVEVGELRTGAPLWLPARRPRALAVEVLDAGGELARLHGELGSALQRACGSEPERRRFRAHITAVRVGGRARADRRWAGSGQCLPATPQLSFAPARIVLYRSWLSPVGATYEAIEASGLSAEQA